MVVATSVDDLRLPPGNKLEALIDDREGQHSVCINGQYRICFVMTDYGATEIEVVDYHQLHVTRSPFSRCLNYSARGNFLMLNLPVPKNAVTVGEIIGEEYRKPLGLTQQQFADALNISRGRYVEIAAGKRGVTLDTALRLARVLGTSPQIWINLQTMYDLSEAAMTPAAAEIAKLKAIIMDPVSSATATEEIAVPSIGKASAMPGRSLRPARSNP